MANEVKEIKITKKTVYSVILAIVLIALLVYYFVYYSPSQKMEKGIQGYKKAVYDSILCQHSCKLEERIFTDPNDPKKNNTVMLPNPACIKSCTDALKAKNLTGNEFSNDNLVKDNLLYDMDGLIQVCKSTNADASGTGVNYAGFFPCVANGLEGLKANYTYLN